MLAMQAGGADVIELGVPFSDPIADGPVIQRANTVGSLTVSNPLSSHLEHYLHQIAVYLGIEYADCLAYVKQARKEGLTIPVVFMGEYYALYRYPIVYLTNSRTRCRVLQSSSCIRREESRTRRKRSWMQRLHHGRLTSRRGQGLPRPMCERRVGSTSSRLQRKY